jgi:type IV pilus assembly protein PilW
MLFPTTLHRTNSRERGLNLIEVMVGLAIGMIGVVIIMQALQFFEARQRTTTAGSDAQVTGTLAMYELDRDIKQAGMGFGRAARDGAANTYLGCIVDASATAVPPAPGASGTANFNFDFEFSPVVITQGAAGAPDQIDVLYGSSRLYVTGQVFDASPGPFSKTTRVIAGFQPGDLVIIAAETGGQCALAEITSNTNADGRTLEHANAAVYTRAAAYGGDQRTAQYNPVGGTGTTLLSGQLYNLGSRPDGLNGVPVATLNRWGIVNNRLVLTNLLTSDPAAPTVTEVAENIINLQARYVLLVDDDGNPVTPPVQVVTEAAPAGAANWSNVQAVQLAVLARSRQYERELVNGAVVQVTPNAPAWAGGAFVMTNIDGSASGAADGSANDWRQYRYRVYESTVLLRNMIWGLE